MNRVLNLAVFDYRNVEMAEKAKANAVLPTTRPNSSSTEQQSTAMSEKVTDRP